MNTVNIMNFVNMNIAEYSDVDNHFATVLILTGTMKIADILNRIK